MYACSHSEWINVGVAGYAIPACCVAVCSCLQKTIESRILCSLRAPPKTKKRLTCFLDSVCDVQPFLFLLQDAQLYRSVVTDSALTS